MRATWPEHRLVGMTRATWSAAGPRSAVRASKACSPGRPASAATGSGLAVGRGEGEQALEVGRARLLPVAPDLHLRVAGALAHRALARGHAHAQLEGLAPELVERHPVEVAPGVHVHLVREQLVAPGRGHDLQGGHEGEVRDRAVARGEEDEVAARGHLAGDALQVVARRVHEVVAGLGHRLGVVDRPLPRVTPGSRLAAAPIDLIEML